LGAHQKTVNKSAADTKQNSSISNKNTTHLKTHNLRLYDLEAGLEVTLCLDEKAFCRVIIGMPSLTFIGLRSSHLVNFISKCGPLGVLVWHVCQKFKASAGCGTCKLSVHMWLAGSQVLYGADSKYVTTSEHLSRSSCLCSYSYTSLSDYVQNITCSRFAFLFPTA